MDFYAKNLKNLFAEIPLSSSQGAHEKLKCILLLYSAMLPGMSYLGDLSVYFSNLHVMSFEIKSILNTHVSESLKHETFERTKSMLIRDIYHLVKMTEFINTSAVDNRNTVATV